MGKIPENLRQIIAANIRACRMKKYPGRGGGKKCAEAFGVSPQQWSPWECGDMREFGVTIRLHPDDIEWIAGRVLAGQAPAQ